MKLKTLLSSYGALAVCCAIILGGIGYWTSSQLSNSMKSMVDATSNLHNSLVANMMHDALRADVLALMLAVENADSTAISEAKNDMAEHSKLFEESLDFVRNNHPSATIQASLTKLTPKLEVYIASAREMSALASTILVSGGDGKIGANLKKGTDKTFDKLNAQRPQFMEVFLTLETEMADFDRQIADENKSVQEIGNRLASNSKKVIIIGSVIVSALLMLLAFVITRKIINPLNNAVGIAQRVASGDFTGIEAAKTSDETGLLMQALKNMSDSLSHLVSQIKSSAEDVSTGAQQIAAGNINLSQRTEEQASSLEETASSMEQMASTVKQNAENAKQANLMATEASSVALKGGDVVNQVISTMSDINTSSKKIVDIISVIDGIAFQTNILALNAAVEAARAGEQGRGFAVVAAEVRSLAQRSATAAKEIKQLIGDSVEKVSYGSLLVQEAGTTMEEVVASVKQVTDIVNEIAAASQEQSVGIDQVNNAITNMDEVVQQNAALVEEAAAAASSLESKAQELTEATNKFRLSDESLLANGGMRRELNKVRAERPSELPAAKANDRSRLKAPKVKKEEDWEEF